MDHRLFICFLGFLLYCNGIWMPKITTVEPTSAYGFAPTLNVSVTLAANASAESVPIGYSDFIGCLKPGFQNDIEVTVGDKKVIIPFDSARLGEYYIMTLQMDGEEINSTSELYVPRYTCQFSIKSPYGLGLTAIRVNALSLICEIPIFPPEWAPEAGMMANFSSITVHYPNGMNYYTERDVTFALQPYWWKQGSNETTVGSGDKIVVDGAFNKDSVYTCSFAAVGTANSAFGTVTAVENNQTICVVPDKAKIELTLLEKVGDSYRVVLFVAWNSTPTLVYKATPADVSVWYKWIALASALGLIVGCLGGAIIAVLIVKRGKRREYHSI